MFYVPQLHEVAPDSIFIFPLLWYCQRKQSQQVARWAQATEGRAGPRMAHGGRGGAEGTRIAGADGQGHSGQRGAKKGQRTQGMGGGIRG